MNAPMGLDEEALSDLAAGRHGVFTRADASEVGATPRQITTALANGRWLRCATNVYSYPGHADTLQRRLWIAALNGGDTAVVGLESAGQIHGFHALDRDRLTLIVDRPRRHAPDGVVWYRLEDLRPDHVTLVDGLAVTTVARTVVDLAAVLRNGRFEQLVEDGIVRGLFTIGEVGGMLAQVRRRGKPGVLRTEATLDLLGPGDGLSHLALEALLDHALALAALPDPHREPHSPRCNASPCSIHAELRSSSTRCGSWVTRVREGGRAMRGRGAGVELRSCGSGRPRPCRRWRGPS